MSKLFSFGRALVIGIGDYIHLSSLSPEPVYDAQDVAKLLVSPTHCGYLPENVHTLLDAQASRSAIVDALQKLAIDAQPSDTVVVYFSGHGAQRLSGIDVGTYLCPHDFDRARVRETGIETEELSDLLKQIRAERLLVLVDACHSAGAARIKDGGIDIAKWVFGGPKLEALAQGKGRVIISASAADEVSWIVSQYRNSLFTHFLLKGLQGDVDKGSDGLIRVLDLFTYLADQVSKVKSTQNPVLTTHTQHNFPIALRKGGRLKSEEAPLIARQDASNASAMEEALVSLYPQGPLESEIWSRAGGDVSGLRLGMNGRAAWHSALRIMAQGGGGAGISRESLLKEAFKDFGNNPVLKELLRD